MPRISKALTPLELRRASEPGLYFAGEGLYLQVTGANARSWLFRYSLAGKPRMMGLGSERHLSLADARKLRDEARALWLRGLDPLEARKRDQAQDLLNRVRSWLVVDSLRSEVPQRVSF